MQKTIGQVANVLRKIFELMDIRSIDPERFLPNPILRFGYDFYFYFQKRIEFGNLIFRPTEP